MCVLCAASRKSRSLSKLIGSSHRASSSSAIASVEHAGFQWSTARAFSAVPQASGSETFTANRIDGFALHPSTINPNVLKAQYAVRGELYNKAVELAAQGRDIIYTNGKW